MRDYIKNIIIGYFQKNDLKTTRELICQKKMMDNRFYDLPIELQEYIHEINRKSILEEYMKHKSMFKECIKKIKPDIQFRMFFIKHTDKSATSSKIYEKKYGIDYYEQPRMDRGKYYIYVLCGNILFSKNELSKKLEENGVVVKKSWRKVDIIRKLMKI